MPDYDHEVFVSYSHRDAEWVMKAFVPGLRRGGLDVDTDEEFDTGMDVARSMALAVLRSRCTVVVLTRNWVSSEWGNFEGNVAEHADQLFPILREHCAATPANIAKKICAEFLDDSRFEVEMAGLVRLLKNTAIDAESSREDPFAATVDRFAALAEDIQIIGDFKEMQDELSTLRLQCVEPIAREAPRLPMDDLPGRGCSGWRRVAGNSMPGLTNATPTQ